MNNKINYFFVDGRKYETDQTALTGSQIKNIADSSVAYHLYVETGEDTPDKCIGDSEAINLRNCVLHFFVVPSATTSG